MSDVTKVTGLLCDLQKLDEAGRDRILDLLSTEVVKEVLKASLRQRDRIESESGASRLWTCAQSSRIESIAPPNPPTTENASGTVHVQEERSTKQARQITILRYRKRPRIEEEDARGQTAVEREVIEIETDEENEANRKNSQSVRRSLRLTGCVGPKHLIADSKGIAINGRRPRELQAYLYVSEGVISNWLPVNVQTDLMHRFEDMWSMKEHTITQYTTYTYNLIRHSSGPLCIHSMLLAKTRPSLEVGNRISPQTIVV
ncbi:hypothetical protein GGP41_010091 [Bipolaris sorokiniana]|uniref:Uncharacterized protein n=2 Tax=Cochliobolus sativus TaxID=45130 RepID=A0A8H5ZGT9_COCSA|nr:uncharacterized protein COCSADRAFT_345315 [Bipolaris sorokiniana ND90Pr]EMD61189.1 hypothetical protein COCSADRAFT_345315 [Bipolaris sorokiniana ND90Pr]KAF5848935.1 hypothetical protein GGP41_010091 [Bipolaris sorokiniana]